LKSYHKKEEKADNGNNDKKEEPKKDEEKSTVGKQDYKDDDKKDEDKKDADKSISTLAELMGTLVKTISDERKATTKRFDKLAEQIKALETPAPAEEHGQNTPVKLNNEYNDDPGSSTRASEDPKDPADKESEDGSVEFVVLLTYGRFFFIFLRLFFFVVVAVIGFLFFFVVLFFLVLFFDYFIFF